MRISVVFILLFLVACSNENQSQSDSKQTAGSHFQSASSVEVASTVMATSGVTSTSDIGASNANTETGEVQKLSLDAIYLDKDEIAEWKVFNSNENKKPLEWMVRYWEKDNASNLPYPTYTFSIPSSWIVGEGYPIVFDLNTEGRKVAEMSGVVSIKRIPSCQNLFDSEDHQESSFTLVKQQNIQLRELYGIKTVIETTLDGDDEGNVFHIYSYCLANKQFAFLMSFQALASDEKSERTFDKVISTLRFGIPELPQIERK